MNIITKYKNKKRVKELQESKKLEDIIYYEENINELNNKKKGE